MSEDRAEQMIREWQGPGDVWRRDWVDGRRVVCGGCGTGYDSAVGLSIVALAASGEERRIFLDYPRCAVALNLPRVAEVMAESEASGMGPLTVDADGRTLPAWRIAEIRDDARWTPGEEPWRDEDSEGVAVRVFLVNPVRDPDGILDGLARDEVGVAAEDEVADLLGGVDEAGAL